jgi:TolB-like protein
VRAAALNPMDGNSIAFLGEMLVYSGDFESGLPLVDRAKQLNPNHSGWYWYADFYNAYRQGDYRGALGFALKVNLPHHWFAHAAIAAAYGQLGERKAAAKAVRDLLEVRPDFAATVRGDIEKWWEPEYVEHIIDGWRKAGLGIPSASETGATVTAANGGAGSPPAEELPVEAPTVPGFDGRPALAVLPFENRSEDPEQEYFADGLAEDLIARLSLWRAFPVIARNSSFSYKGKDVDLQEVSAGLGVRYLVQGSVRKAGSRVRIAAQLVDAVTGQNVWAQSYDRELTDVFAVQDEISEAIAASLVVDLQHAEHEHIRHCTPESLEAWGLYQRALASFYRFTPENFEQGQALLERATELEPGFSTAWARLAEVGIWQILHGWTDSPDETLELALEQARRAVDLDPRNAEAHAELAFALMTAGDGNAAIEEARRSMELNPSHPMALLFYAYFWHMTGHPTENSIELVDRAMRLSPRDPTEWLFYDVLAGAYFNAGRFDDGLAASRRLIGLWPEYYFGQLWCAMNAVGLGQLEVAQAAIREARQLLPELSLAMVRRVLGAMGPDVDRRMMGALQEAGLE